MAKEEKKLSYEELNNIAHQLSNQAESLAKKLQESNQANFFNRLNFLFKVVEFGDRFSMQFLDNCVSEIEELMTIPKEENK